MKKLNIGCGKESKIGYINLDIADLDGVDIVHNLNKYPWPFKDNEFDEIYCSHVLQQLDDIIKPLEEIYRIAKNKANVIIKVPIFPGILAMSDPMHRQFYTYMTFNYFEPQNKGLDYYSKAKFKILKREIIFHKALRFLNSIVNSSKFIQKFHSVFLSFLIPAIILEIKLQVVK